MAGGGGESPGQAQGDLVQEDVANAVVIARDQVRGIALQHHQFAAGIGGRVAAGAVTGGAAAICTC